MDRASLLEHLERANRRVADCEEFIDQQRHLIGELDRDHQGTTVAKFLEHPRGTCGDAYRPSQTPRERVGSHQR